MRLQHFKFVPSEIYGTFVEEEAYDISSPSLWETLGQIIERNARLAGLKGALDIHDKKLSEIEKMMVVTSTILSEINYLKMIKQSDGQAIVTIRRYSKGLEIVIEAGRSISNSIDHIGRATSDSLEFLLAYNQFGIWHAQNLWEPYPGLIPDRGTRYVLAMPANPPHAVIDQISNGHAVLLPLDKAMTSRPHFLKTF